MKTPLYRQALRESWELAWGNKLLWVFGFFAAFLGQMGLLELFTKIGFVGTKYAFSLGWSFVPQFFSLPFSLGRAGLSLDGSFWLAWLMIIFVGFALFLVFVAVVSQGALVHAAAQRLKGKKSLNVDKAWHAGVGHFWRLFGINALKKAVLIVFATLLVSAMVNVSVYGRMLDVFWFVLLFLLAVLVGLVLSFLVIYAAGYVVVEEYTLSRAVASAWKLFLGHWLVSLEAGIIVLLLDLALSVLILASFFVLFLPTMLLWMIAVSIASSTLYIIAMAIGMALFVLFVVFVGSVWSVFTTSLWTHLFMKMHKEGVASRILGWAGVRR